MKKNGIGKHLQPTIIKLNEEDIAELRQLEGRVNLVKVALADVQMRILVLEAERANVANEVKTAIDALLVVAAKMTSTHGIDSNDPSKGRWNIDTAAMTLTRIA